jgi:hypothetical protein
MGREVEKMGIVLNDRADFLPDNRDIVKSPKRRVK